MTNHDDDPLADALARLPAPPLDPEWAARVGRVAHLELAPAPGEQRLGWRFTLSGALVPALLMSAAVIRTADSIRIAGQAFGGDRQPRERGPRGRPPRAPAPLPAGHPGQGAGHDEDKE